MSKIDFNDLLNPVGSVTHSFEGSGSLSKREYEVSADNPAMKLIESMEASGKYNKDNVGDLYDKALQWEIDRADWIDQLTVDQAIKAEQREYDSDLARVQRAREAGLNLDLAGSNGSSGSSGSSGTQAGASSHDNTGGVGNTDNYASRMFALQVIDTAGQLLNNVSASVSSVMNGAAQLRTAGSLGKVHEAQAGLADAQADEILSLIDGRVDYQNNANVSAFMTNAAKMSEILGQGFTDEDATKLFDTAGIPVENHAGYADTIRKIQERPEFVTRWHGNKLAARYTKEQEQQYTEEYVCRMVTRGKEIETDSQINQLYLTQMERKLNEILAYDKGFVQDQADQILKSTELGATQADQAFKEFKEYCYSYGERIDYAKQKIAELDKELAPYVTFDSDGNIKSVKSNLSPAEKAFVDASMDSRMLIKYGAANDMMLFTNAINNFNMQAYIKNEMVRDKDGSLKTLNGRQKIVQFGEALFGKSITGVKSGFDIASQAISCVGSVVSGVGGVVLGAAGQAAKAAYQASKGYQVSRGAASDMSSFLNQPPLSEQNMYGITFRP